MKKEELFEAWENNNTERMTVLMKKHLSKYETDDEREQVAILKHDFESELPHKQVADAVGCPIRTCRDIRWMGDDYGVVDRTGTRDRESIPPSKRESVMARDDNECVRCGSDDDLEIHHIIPLSQGGLDFKDNLCTLCKSCNKEAHVGDFSSKRAAYDGKREFWDDFVDSVD